MNIKSYETARRRQDMDQSMHDTHSWTQGQYTKLLVMLAFSFASMYILMYSMVDRFGNVYPNLNQFYMAGLMTAPMAILELALMGKMYPNKKRNSLVLVGGLVALIVFWALIRQQVAISDRDFLKSMIPHHAGALLMCGKADLRDAEIKALCRSIQRSQQAEIDQMRAILSRIDAQKAE